MRSRLVLWGARKGGRSSFLRDEIARAEAAGERVKVVRANDELGELLGGSVHPLESVDMAELGLRVGER